MSDFSLPRYANGDTDYVSKMDNSADLIETAIRVLQDSSGGALVGLLSFTYLLSALFADDPVLIGYDSYKCTGSGATLSVAAGAAWKPSTQTVVQFAAGGTLDFTGQPADTYYLAIDAAGTPSRSTDGSEAYYSIVWTGSAFGAITRTAKCFMVADDEQALLHSTELSMDFPTLLARLENDESLISGGGISIPGPYADDTAAASGGVSVGQPYYLTTSGYVVVRTV